MPIGLKTIVQQWHPPRDRVLWTPVFLGIGVAAYFAWPTEPPILAAAIACAVLLSLVAVARARAPAAFFPVFALLLVMLGVGVAQWRTHVAATPQISKIINITRLEGRIVDIGLAEGASVPAKAPSDKTAAKKSKRRVTLGDLSIEKLPASQTPRFVRLSSYHFPDNAAPGARVSVQARLMPPSGPVTPGGFDYRRQAFFEGIGAVGFTMGGYAQLSPPQASRDIWFNDLRQRLATRISAAMPHPLGAVTSAIQAGERAAIPDDVNQDLIDSGLYHLLSISGIHVAIVCGVTFFCLRFLMALWPALALRLPIKKMAAAAALLVGLFYSMLAGMPVPTQRAMMMTGLALVAVMLDRSVITMRAIALAALFVLLLSPDALVGVSFQLSFAAVLAMVAFHEGAGRAMLTANRERSWLFRVFLYFVSIAVTTVLVSLATLAPVLHHFGRLQLYGIVANAVAIPLTSFVVMPAGMAALLMIPVGWDGPFLAVTAWGTEKTLAVAHWVAHLPQAALTLPGLPLPYYVAAMAGFLLLCLWRGWFRWAGVPVMATAILLGVILPARPFAMLDADGRVLAAHDSAAGQTAYFFRTPSDYVRKNWLALWGGQEFQDGKPVKSGQWTQGATAVFCDDYACRIEVSGTSRASVVKNITAMPDECAWAQAIVVLDRALPDEWACAAPVMNVWDLGRAGGVAFYDTGTAAQMRTFTARTGQRPWSVRHAARTSRKNSVILPVKP